MCGYFRRDLWKLIRIAVLIDQVWREESSRPTTKINMTISRQALFGKLGVRLYRGIESATNFCKLRGNPFVELVHWLHQLLQQPDGDLQRIVRHAAIDRDGLERDFARALAALPAGASSISDFSWHIESAIERAWVRATLEYGDRRVRGAWLIAALVSVPELRRVMLAISPAFGKIPVDGFDDVLPAWIAGSPEADDAPYDHSEYLPATPGDASGATPGAPKGGTLDQYCADLTARARAGEIDPVIGRELEIRTMIDVLLRRRQNNPLVTGEAGVGKTAVVEGLAGAIASGNVPPKLADVRLLSLDVGALLAGASMKGEFEARLKALLEAAAKSPVPVILFIDEIHMLIGAGGQAGTFSFQLANRPDTPAPIEIAQTHDDTMSLDACAACEAWKKIASGPAYEIRTARKPAVIAETDQSLPIVRIAPGGVFGCIVVGECGARPCGGAGANDGRKPRRSGHSGHCRCNWQFADDDRCCRLFVRIGADTWKLLTSGTDLQHPVDHRHLDPAARRQRCRARVERVHGRIGRRPRMAREQFAISAADHEAAAFLRIRVASHPVCARQVVPRQLRQVVMDEVIVVVQVQQPHREAGFVDRDARFRMRRSAMLVQRADHRERQRGPRDGQQVIPPRHADRPLQPREQRGHARGMRRPHRQIAEVAAPERGERIAERRRDGERGPDDDASEESLARDRQRPAPAWQPRPAFARHVVRFGIDAWYGQVFVAMMLEVRVAIQRVRIPDRQRRIAEQLVHEGETRRVAVQQFMLQRQVPRAEQDQRRRRGGERQVPFAHEQQHGEPAAVDDDDQQPGRPLGAGSEAGVERGDRARVVDVEVFGHGVEADGSGSAGNERWNRGARPGCAGVSRITVGLPGIAHGGGAGRPSNGTGAARLRQPIDSHLLIVLRPISIRGAADA